ncbi:hypothetical protein J6590_035572 [Homalodisca vitripennis]|nr:hypothetical protein J6590_035572 [Homalodisca vitripennis]
MPNGNTPKGSRDHTVRSHTIGVGDNPVKCPRHPPVWLNVETPFRHYNGMTHGTQSGCDQRKDFSPVGSYFEADSRLRCLPDPLIKAAMSVARVRLTVLQLESRCEVVRDIDNVHLTKECCKLVEVSAAIYSTGKCHRDERCDNGVMLKLNQSEAVDTTTHCCRRVLDSERCYQLRRTCQVSTGRGMCCPATSLNKTKQHNESSSFSPFPVYASTRVFLKLSLSTARFVG